MRAASIGECMVEISGEGRSLALGYGGDTLNTAVYLSRLGVTADYATALGDDPFSDDMVAGWRAEGVGTGLVLRVPGRRPGLYVIRTDHGGERRFFYWREQAPARDLFELPGATAVAAKLRSYDLIYFSGISLSIYSERGRAVLHETLRAARARGAKIAFDPNYRAAGWSSPADAAGAFTAMLEQVDIALPTFEDEEAVFADQSVEACLARLRAIGVSEAVVKRGARGCVISTSDNGVIEVPAPEMVMAVDTTAAGDSFNAGYLAARLHGVPPEEAAEIGGRLAAKVVQYPGAIIPPAAMPADLIGAG